jgi:hypothetical protein
MEGVANIAGANKNDLIVLLMARRRPHLWENAGVGTLSFINQR